MRILLDLDGVIVDFITGAFEAHGITNVKQEDIVHWDLEALIGIETGDFWAKFDEDFWAGLKMYDWVEELLYLLEKWDVCLLTSPGWTGAGGKQRWIRENLPWFFKNNRYLIGPGKEFCASKDTVLIDDYDANCKKFRNAGGHSIVFPQPWNTAANLIYQRLEYVTEKLEDIQCELSD
jgi:hypothetical protein